MASGSGTFARVWSGALALVVVVPAMVVSRYSAAAICAIAAILGLREFYGMALPAERDRIAALAGVFAVLAMAAATVAHGGPGDPAPRPDLLLVPFGLAVVAGTSYFLLTATGTEGLAQRACFFLAGWTYVVGSIVFLPLLYAWGEARGAYVGVRWVWLALIVPWAADTGAYFAGRAFGRHRMSPVISPKKTWEGLAGGVAAAIAAALLYRLVFRFTDLGLLDCAVLGAAGAIAGAFGDLVESMLKRSFGVKDSGVFLPGHGGILDRIDSVMFVMPLAYFYAVARFG